MENIILFLISLITALVSGYLIIPVLKRLKVGQNVSEYGPTEHQKKSGTPTMGGVIIQLACLVGILVMAVNKAIDIKLILVIITSLGFGLVGFVDDFIMLVLKRAEGLTPKQKIAFQILISILVLYLYKANYPNEFGRFFIPFINQSVDLGIFSYFIYIFVLIGTVNAVNLTDGLDGLVTSVSLPVLGFIYFITKNVASLNSFSLVFLGALLGFLVYNTNKASVFMGDTGSMTIGGMVAAYAMVTGTIFLLPIFGFIYFIETLSVIIQVASVKTRKKKVFLFTPIHHHYEYKGYNEQKIVTAFMVTSLIMSIMAFLLIGGKGWI